MDGLSLARSHTHTRSTANGVAAMAMALHEAFIVCLFLSFVHGLPKIYCHPARWIRLALSHSLTDTHTHTPRYSRTLACAANFRKLTKLFSLLGFAGWIPMLIYEHCKLVRCFRTVHPPTPTPCVCYIHTYSPSKWLCVCLFGYLIQESPPLSISSSRAFCSQTTLIMPCFLAVSVLVLVVLLLVVAVVIVFFLLFTLNWIIVYVYSKTMHVCLFNERRLNLWTAAAH